MSNKIMRPIVLILSVSLLYFGYLSPSIEKAYAAYMTSRGDTLSFEVAKWSLKVNYKTRESVTIELKDTLIQNNYSMTKVIPGTKGKIDLEIDFTNTEVSTKYNISVDATNSSLPDNLKLYTDAEMTNELTSIDGVVNLEDIDTAITKEIYWKWIFTDTDETADWSNKDITLELVLNTSQRIIEGP